MKNGIIIILLNLIVSIGFSQAENVDVKLMQFYGEKYLNNLSSLDPGGFKFLNYYSANGYFLEESPKNLEEFKDINEVPRRKSKNDPNDFNQEFTTIENFNINSYDIRVLEHRQYFKVGNTNQLLVIKSRKEITEAINKQ